MGAKRRSKKRSKYGGVTIVEGNQRYADASWLDRIREQINRLPKWLVFGGAAFSVLWAIGSLMKKKLTSLLGTIIYAGQEDAFAAAIPAEAQPYADVILRVSREKGVDPFIIVAIGMRESRWGTRLSPPGPGGTGDGGHGRGIMQIDDRSFGVWLLTNNWTDPYTNVAKGTDILKAKMAYVQSHSNLTGADLLEAAIAAYNTGEGNVVKSINAGMPPDTTTTGGDYSADVIAKASDYTNAFTGQVATV